MQQGVSLGVVSRRLHACVSAGFLHSCIQICVGTEAATTAVALPTYSQPLQLLPQRQPAITAAGQLALRQALC